MAALSEQLSSMFGVKLTSGFRKGAVTEFGNASLHGLGRAIDLGGTASQMQAVWNYLLGNKGISELIYNGKASYNGGSPVPFAGSDKHTDHVHVGIGDGRGVVSSTTSNSGPTVSFAGAVFHINTEKDYEEFIEKLADDLERITGSKPAMGAGGMIDG
jgi:hypothetical protein